MKILLITPRFYPEPFTITRIAEELSNRNHEITVLTGRPNYGQWKIYDGYKNIKEEMHKGIKIIRLREIPRRKGFIGLVFNYLSILFVYKKALKNITDKFDIVFSHVMSPIFVMDGVGNYCKKTNTPHFHYGFDLWPESLVATGFFKRGNPLFSLFKRDAIKNYCSCDTIAFASLSAEKYFTDYLKINVNFEHIYQPCLASTPSSDFVGNHQFAADGKVHILFCGTIARFNRLDLMINALNDKTLKQRFVLHIVGSGSEKDKLQRIVNKLSLSDTVIFHGRVSPEETKQYYKMSDVLFVPLFCNSATSLMIPQKLIEYLMYSRPIFGMIKGDGEALLKQASTLNIISDQTVSDLRQALLKISDMSNNDLEKCGIENRNFFLSHPEFSLEDATNKIENTMYKLVSKSRQNE